MRTSCNHLMGVMPKTGILSDGYCYAKTRPF
jgi:hypothetical protein